MKKKNKILIINILLLFSSFFNIFIINEISKNNIEEYSYMLASKITKYIVNNAYVREKINYYANEWFWSSKRFN